MRITVVNILALLLIACGGLWSILCSFCATSSAVMVCHTPVAVSQEVTLAPCCCALTCAEEQIPALLAAELLTELQIGSAQIFVQYGPRQRLPRFFVAPTQPQKVQALFRLHCSYLI